MNKLLQRIKLNELAFDLAMIIMAGLLYSAVFPGGIIPKAGEHTLLHQHLIVLAEFVFAFVMGKHGAAFIKHKLEKAKWRKYYYYVVSFYILAIAYISIPIILDAVGIFSYAAGFFACTMGFMTGNGTWNEKSYMGEQVKNRKEIKEEKEKRGKGSQWEKGFASMSKDYPVLIGIPFLALFYGIIFLVNQWADLSGFLGVLAFIGIVLVPVIFMFVIGFSAVGISLLINKIRLFSKAIDIALMKVIFPMSLAFLFLMWGRIYHFYVVGGDAGIARIILISVFLGLIPYRVLLLIRPPFNRINFIIGIIAFVLYFLAMSF